MNRFGYLKYFFMALVFQGVVGCVTTPQELSDFEPIIRPIAPAVPTYKNGSLFQMSSLSLFEDMKPYRIGDLITVRLSESTNATKKATTNTKKEESFDLGMPILFGNTPTGANSRADVDIEADREFKGEGDSTQSNQLSGEITVTVVDILPNGNLVVQGEKWFTLNQGKEYIRIAGVIRPKDVGQDNSVTSTKLADAQIAYSGEGFIADSNNQGWLGQFFNGKWWPF